MKITKHIGILVLVSAALHLALAIAGLKTWRITPLELILTATAAAAIVLVAFLHRERPDGADPIVVRPDTETRDGKRNSTDS